MHDPVRFNCAHHATVQVMGSETGAAFGTWLESPTYFGHDSNSIMSKTLDYEPGVLNLVRSRLGRPDIIRQQLSTIYFSQENILLLTYQF